MSICYYSGGVDDTFLWYKFKAAPKHSKSHTLKGRFVQLNDFYRFLLFFYGVNVDLKNDLLEIN